MNHAVADTADVHVSVTKDVSEFCRGVNAFRWRNPGMYFVYLLGLALLIYSLVVLTTDGGSASAGAMLVVSTYIVGTTTYNMTLGLRRAFRKSSPGEVEWRFDHAGVHRTWSDGEVSVPWNSIRRVAVTREFLLLYQTRQIGMAVPRRALTDEQIDHVVALHAATSAMSGAAAEPR